MPSTLTWTIAIASRISSSGLGGDGALHASALPGCANAAAASAHATISLDLIPVDIHRTYIRH